MARSECSIFSQGFMIKVVSSKYNTEHWSLEEETLMIANQAGLYFSLAWRVFYGFGLAVRAQFNAQAGQGSGSQLALPQ